MQCKFLFILIFLFFFQSISACQRKKYFNVPVYPGVTELKYTNPYYIQAAQLLIDPQTTDTFLFPDKTRRVTSFAAQKKYALDHMQPLKNPEGTKKNLRHLMNKAVLSLADYLKEQENNFSDGTTTHQDYTFTTISSLIIDNKTVRSDSLSSLSESVIAKKDNKLLLHEQRQKDVQVTLKNQGDFYLKSWNRLLDMCQNVQDAHNAIENNIAIKNNLEEEQAKKIDIVETILPKFQAIVRGRLVRNNLSQIQQQLLYEKESSHQKSLNKKSTLNSEVSNYQKSLNKKSRVDVKNSKKTKKQKNLYVIDQAVKQVQEEDKNISEIIKNQYACLVTNLNSKDPEQLRFGAAQIKDVKKHIPEILKKSNSSSIEDIMMYTFGIHHKKALDQLNQKYELQLSNEQINVIIEGQKNCVKALFEFHKTKK
ncbi:MAG: hypothetical protein ACXWL5_00190 [Candidatus Chromulinivorax sp.]